MTPQEILLKVHFCSSVSLEKPTVSKLLHAEHTISYLCMREIILHFKNFKHLPLVVLHCVLNVKGLPPTYAIYNVSRKHNLHDPQIFNNPIDTYSLQGLHSFPCSSLKTLVPRAYKGMSITFAVPHTDELVIDMSFAWISFLTFSSDIYLKPLLATVRMKARSSVCFPLPILCEEIHERWRKL